MKRRSLIDDRLVREVEYALRAALHKGDKVILVVDDVLTPGIKGVVLGEDSSSVIVHWEGKEGIWYMNPWQVEKE